MFKEIGTLAEIGAKVGDVVGDDTGCVIKVRPWHIEDCRRGHYRIVSRAQTGPVITETVKRIVPGVYGHFRIAVVSGVVYVSMTQDGEADHAYRMSRADLIAARDVFNQLIDSLDE